VRHAAVPLDEIVTIAGGGTPSTNRPEYFMGHIPWVSPKDMKCWDIVDSMDHVTEEAIANSSTTLIARDAVLVVTRSGVLKHTLPVAINRVPVTLNQDMKALICGERVIPDYLARALQALSSKLLQTVRGTTADNISTDVLRALEIPLPTLPEQRRIARRLEQADRLRRTRRYALETTDTFLPAAFLELFGDPVKNPRGFDHVELGDDLECIESGFSPVCEGPRKSVKQWAILSLGAVTTGVFNPAENKRLPDEIPLVRSLKFMTETFW
jgi:type I restriction enzyme, S subunit